VIVFGGLTPQLKPGGFEIYQVCALFTTRNWRGPSYYLPIQKPCVLIGDEDNPAGVGKKEFLPTA
jgi:hypothetical protein